MAGHSRQFTPGGLPDNCETHCVSGNRTHDLPIVSPTRYQLCHRDHHNKHYTSIKNLLRSTVPILFLKLKRQTLISQQHHKDIPNVHIILQQKINPRNCRTKRYIKLRWNLPCISFRLFLHWVLYYNIHSWHLILVETLALQLDDVLVHNNMLVEMASLYST